MRTAPPRPGRPPSVTPGRRLSTSLTLLSPMRSSSSRPITILAALDSRRTSVSLAVPMISTRSSAGAVAGGRVVGSTVPCAGVSGLLPAWLCALKLDRPSSSIATARVIGVALRLGTGLAVGSWDGRTMGRMDGQTFGGCCNRGGRRWAGLRRIVGAGA